MVAVVDVVVVVGDDFAIFPRVKPSGRDRCFGSETSQRGRGCSYDSLIH